jgi:hypothetical protein
MTTEKKRMPYLTREQVGHKKTNTKFVVTDHTGTYRAWSFREAQRVLWQCHAERLTVRNFIAMYCES